MLLAAGDRLGQERPARRVLPGEDRDVQVGVEARQGPRTRDRAGRHGHEQLGLGLAAGHDADRPHVGEHVDRPVARQVERDQTVDGPLVGHGDQKPSHPARRIQRHRDQPETPADLRLAMLRAAVQGRPSLKVDARELGREGPSYTVDTLQELQRDEIYGDPGALADLSEEMLDQLKPAEAGDPHGLLGRALGGLGRVSYNRWKLTLVLTMLTLVASVIGISRIRVNDNPVKWFTPEGKMMRRGLGCWPYYARVVSGYYEIDAEQEYGENFML